MCGRWRLRNIHGTSSVAWPGEQESSLLEPRGGVGAAPGKTPKAPGSSGVQHRSARLEKEVKVPQKKKQNPRQQQSLVKPEFLLQHPSLSLSGWLQKQHTPPLAANARRPGAGPGPCRGCGVRHGRLGHLPRGQAGAVTTQPLPAPWSGPRRRGSGERLRPLSQGLLPVASEARS